MSPALPPSVAAPKRRKNASRKNKKSWRKNPDLDDVEDFLDDQRLEARLGGDFAARKDEELFVVDQSGGGKDDDGAKDNKADGGKLRRRRDRSAKPLKCLQHLEITTGVPDPISKRNRVRTVEERRNPIVKRQEAERRAKGIKKAKEIQAKKDRAADAAARVASKLERSTRRRTKFDFDLWDADKTPKEIASINADEWIGDTAKRHNLKSTGRLAKKTPNDLRRDTSSLPAVQAPLPGASYNPSYSDHQELLWKAAIVELNKEKATHKIAFHTTMMFPSAKNAPTKETWIKEMSEGIKELTGPEEQEEEVVEEDEEEDDDDIDTGNKKLKTKKQRRKEKEAKAEVARRKRVASDKRKNVDVLRAKSLRKSIRASEAETAAKMKKRQTAKEERKATSVTLSGHKFVEPDLEIKLSDELTGNLRSLKPEGNLLEDRYKSLQRRNVIEPRVRQKIVKNPKRTKRLEKRNYKMPWQKAT